MQKTNVRVGALDDLPIQLKNQTQHPVLHTNTPAKHNRSPREVKHKREGGQSSRMARQTA